MALDLIISFFFLKGCTLYFVPMSCCVRRRRGEHQTAPQYFSAPLCQQYHHQHSCCNFLRQSILSLFQLGVNAHVLLTVGWRMTAWGHKTYTHAQVHLNRILNWLLARQNVLYSKKAIILPFAIVNIQLFAKKDLFTNFLLNKSLFCISCIHPDGWHGLKLAEAWGGQYWF